MAADIFSVGSQSDQALRMPSSKQIIGSLGIKRHGQQSNNFESGSS